MARVTTVAALLLGVLALAATPVQVAAADADSDGIDDASDNCPNFCSDEIPARVSDDAGFWNSCNERYPGSTRFSDYLALRDRFPADTSGLSGASLSMSNACTEHCSTSYNDAAQPGLYDPSTGYGSSSSSGFQFITLEFTQGPELLTSITVGPYQRAGWGSGYFNGHTVEYLDEFGSWQVIFTTPGIGNYDFHTYTLPTPVTTSYVRMDNDNSGWVGVGTFMAFSAGRCAAQGGNPDQSDADGDGIGDLCDDYWFSASNSYTDLSIYDLDGNGICDGIDVSNGNFLCIGNAASGDSDGDGICDDEDPCPNDAGSTDCLDHGGGAGGPGPPAACDDNIHNGDEDDIDCGGSCPFACGAAGAPCADEYGCDSGVCAGDPAVCQDPTCDDGVQNGDESCADYGGPCPTVSFLPSLGVWGSTTSDGSEPIASIDGVLYYHFANAGDAQVSHLECDA